MLNGRYLKNEITQYLFNIETVSSYVANLNEGKPAILPHILIEVCIEGADIALFEGDGNLDKKKDCGISFKIAFDEKYQAEYEELIKGGSIKTVPIEYYDIVWTSFARQIELGNTGSEVYSLINQIRDRVKMQHVQAVEGAGLSQVSLRNVLRHERRVELAFEGLRFFDIKRWGIVKNAYDRMITDKVLAMGVLYQERKSETFPIPQSELDANKNLIQNDEWK